MHQARRGGFEKYPKPKDLDQSQYWASSPNKLKLVLKTAKTLRATRKNIIIEKVLFTIIFVINIIQNKYC